ncbi:hypothetical protein LIER_00848 [Lithospermum erythrorhizon]|uniref:Uncharacterized protein n=1 Tax=Lithospermum erythrorhizon TaxID=34254 RepID=A0AAV3NL98_LITER
MSEYSSGSGSNNDDQNNPEKKAAPPEIPYRNDNYMMNEFKIKECAEIIQELFPHAASTCPLVHKGQTRRRDPITYKYFPKLCPNIGDCDDYCDYAHNIYEYCLHPKIFSRSRCIYGLKCKTYPCLFAHNPAKLLALMKPPLPRPPRKTPPPGRRLPPLPCRPPFQLPELQEGGIDGASTSGSKAEEDEILRLPANMERIARYVIL